MIDGMANMRICATGNPNFGLARELRNLYPDTVFFSRASGYDLTSQSDQLRLADDILGYDVFINNSALWKFNQTVLLDMVYKKLLEHKKHMHIICIGSTTDRVKNGKVWLYNVEKKALRDYCNSMAINGVWGDGPKVSYISFGTLSNNQSKHPSRVCMDTATAAYYVKWMIDQPKNININEISIDPMQDAKWSVT